jgi:tetratricopeptide (TPR) repeat protein
MSVLAQVLDDLAARGAAPRGLQAQALGAAIAPLPGTSGSVRRWAPTRRQGLWLATLAILACTTAVLAVIEVRAKSQTAVPRPLGLHDLDAIVTAAATPAVISTVSSATNAAPASAAPPLARRTAPATQADTTSAVAQQRAAAPVAVVHTTRAAAPTATTTTAVPAAALAAPAAHAALPAPQDDAPVVRRSAASLNDPQADLARAAELIARGRAREAKPLLLDLLARNPRDAAARKALAALQSEAGERTEALVTLLDGASVDPARFASAAAQLQTELGDARGALDTLQRMPPERRDGGFYALAGGIALAAEAPQQAVEAYQRAVSAANAQPLWLVGLALAHEAAGQAAEARAAYARAAQLPTLPADARAFVQQRLGSAPQATVRPSTRVQ